MARGTLALPAMNAGEFSPKFTGRQDLAAYPAACHKLENFHPLIQGPAERRAGSVFVAEVKDSSDQTWLVPFIRSRSVAYVLEFGDLYVRFYFNRGLVLTGSTSSLVGVTAANPPVVTTSGAHGYSNGQDVYITGASGMTQINNRFFKVANVTSTTFELQDMFGSDVDGTGYDAYTSGGTVDKPYEVVSPYSAAALTTSAGEFALDWAQSGDVLYLTDRTGTLQPRKLSRTSSTSWAFSTFDPDDGPFADVNDSTTTMYISHASGSGRTITASASVFTADHVGALIRIDQEELTSTEPWEQGQSYSTNDYVRSEGHEYQAQNTDTSESVVPNHTKGTAADGQGGVQWQYITSSYGVARITAQAGTTATVDVLTTFPQTTVGSGNASTLWQFGAWSDALGYPETVSFWKNRLVFGRDDTVYFSVGNKFEKFNPDEFGEVVATSAIVTQLQSDQVNAIVGMVGSEDGLAAFTEGSEWIIGKISDSEAFGPTNVDPTETTAYGARPLKQQRVGTAALFVTTDGEALRELRYDIREDGLVAPDMTVRAEHIIKGGATWTAWQNTPLKQLRVGRSDGQMLTFSYDRDQEVLGWSRMIAGGSFGSGDPTYDSGAVIPSPSNDRDELFVIVKRTINGATKRYVEYFAAEFEEGDDQDDAIYVDSCITYDSSSATTLSGYHHLEGESVSILADGAKQPAKTVSAGQITLDLAASTVQVGLAYTSTYASLELEGGSASGTRQAKRTRVKDIAYRVDNTLGGQGGVEEGALSDIKGLNYRTPATPMDTAPALVSADVIHKPSTKWTSQPRIWFQTSDPFPATITAAYPQVRVNENRR